MLRELASAPDDSYTAELMAAHGVPKNWRETFQAEIDQANEEGLFNPGDYCVYVPNTCAPKETDTLSDVTFSPLIEEDERLVIMDGFEHVPRAGSKSEQEQANAATPIRFAQRATQDGFDKVTREKVGERNFEAKVAAVNLTDARCIELAHSHELRIADWTALTGVGCGELPSYLITAKGVAFRNWPEREIREASVNQQIDMHRDNEAEPLQFPCTPVRFMQFIDAAPPGSHNFTVPESFRRALLDSERSTDVAAEAIQQVSQDQGWKSSEANPEHEVLAKKPDECGGKAAPASSEASQEYSSTAGDVSGRPPRRGFQEREVLRKRDALIEELEPIWPTIRQDLSDASRPSSGLSAAARSEKYGFWRVFPALEWASQRGKIVKKDAEAFVRQNDESELAFILKTILQAS